MSLSYIINVRMIKKVQKDWRIGVNWKLSTGLLANWGFVFHYDSAANVCYIV